MAASKPPDFYTPTVTYTEDNGKSYKAIDQVVIHESVNTWPTADISLSPTNSNQYSAAGLNFKDIAAQAAASQTEAFNFNANPSAVLAVSINKNGSSGPVYFLRGYACSGTGNMNAYGIKFNRLLAHSNYAFANINTRPYTQLYVNPGAAAETAGDLDSIGVYSKYFGTLPRVVADDNNMCSWLATILQGLHNDTHAFYNDITSIATLSPKALALKSVLNINDVLLPGFISFLKEQFSANLERTYFNGKALEGLNVGAIDSTLGQITKADDLNQSFLDNFLSTFLLQITYDQGYPSIEPIDILAAPIGNITTPMPGLSFSLGNVLQLPPVCVGITYPSNQNMGNAPETTGVAGAFETDAISDGFLGVWPTSQGTRIGKFQTFPAPPWLKGTWVTGGLPPNITPPTAQNAGFNQPMSPKIWNQDISGLINAQVTLALTRAENYLGGTLKLQKWAEELYVYLSLQNCVVNVTLSCNMSFTTGKNYNIMAPDGTLLFTAYLFGQTHTIIMNQDSGNANTVLHFTHARANGFTLPGV